MPPDFRQHRVLRNSFWIKLVFILIEVALAIAFGTCNFKKIYDAAAILEWAIAFVFTFYVLSFIYDLIPAVKTRGAPLSRPTEMAMEANDGDSNNMNGRNTAESERTLGRNDVRNVDGVKPPVGRNF